MAYPIYKQIVDAVGLEVEKNFDKAFRKMSTGVLKKIGDTIRKAIKTHPTYFRITGNTSVYHQLGVDNIKERIDEIIELIISELKFEYLLPRGRRTSYGFKITILNLNFDKILSSEAANFWTGKYNLPWLRWLLLDGDRPVIVGHWYKGVESRHSRTGLGLMIKGYSWSVPNAVNDSRTRRNNWFTQSIDKINNKITTIIEEAIQKAF